jgi:hypothetical protein
MKLEPSPGRSGCAKPDPAALIIALKILYYLATRQMHRIPGGYRSN